MLQDTALSDIKSMEGVHRVEFFILTGSLYSDVHLKGDFFSA